MAIAMQAVCAVAMCFLSFRDLMFYVGFLLNAFSVLAVASLFVFRKRAGWQRLGVVNFAWPLIPAFYILVGAWVAGSGFLMRPSVSLAALATVALGAFAYKIFLAPRSGDA
jgi:APA family basic amino acid/polyamine antiporter